MVMIFDLVLSAGDPERNIHLILNNVDGSLNVNLGVVTRPNEFQKHSIFIILAIIYASVMRNILQPSTLVAFLSVLFSIVVLLTFPGCIAEVFEPDKDDPRLPRYTQKGNQVAGALINDVAWKTNYETHFGGASEVFFLTNYASGDSLVVRMKGKIIEGIDSGTNIDLRFVLRDIQVTEVKDVLKLRGVNFVLDGTDTYGMIDDYDERLVSGVKIYNGGIGEFFVKSVIERTNVTITGPEPYHPCIVSGTFHFTSPHSNNIFEVTSGRFDFHFGRGNLELR